MVRRTGVRGVQWSSWLSRNGHGRTAKATAFAAVTATAVIVSSVLHVAVLHLFCTANAAGALLDSSTIDTWIMSARGFALSFRELGPRLISAILEFVILAGSALSP